MGIFDSITGLFKKKDEAEDASAEQLRQEALKLLATEDAESHDRAIGLMEQVTRLDPEHIGTYLSLSAAYLMRCERLLRATPVDKMLVSLDVTAGTLALQVWTEARGSDKDSDLLFHKLKACAAQVGIGQASSETEAPPLSSSPLGPEALAKKIRFAPSTAVYVEHTAQAIRHLNDGDAAYLVCLKATLWEDDPYRRADGLAALKALRPSDQHVMESAGMMILEWYKQEPMQEFVPLLEGLMSGLGMSPM